MFECVPAFLKCAEGKADSSDLLDCVLLSICKRKVNAIPVAEGAFSLQSRKTTLFLLKKCTVSIFLINSFALLSKHPSREITMQMQNAVCPGGKRSKCQREPK